MPNLCQNINSPLFIFLVLTIVPLYARNTIVTDTVAGDINSRFGPHNNSTGNISNNSERAFPLSTILFAAKSDIENITFRQSEVFECQVEGVCLRTPHSKILWLMVHFKDNSRALIKLSDIDSRRVDFLYSHSLVESTPMVKIISHGPDREPILVRTYSKSRSQYQTIHDPEIIALVLGIYHVRISGSLTKKLSKESQSLVTTLIEIESTLQPPQVKALETTEDLPKLNRLGQN